MLSYFWRQIQMYVFNCTRRGTHIEGVPTPELPRIWVLDGLSYKKPTFFQYFLRKVRIEMWIKNSIHKLLFFVRQWIQILKKVVFKDAGTGRGNLK